MAKQAILSANSLRKTPWQRFVLNFKKNWQLHAMILIPLAYMLLFEFGPMYGLQIAFKEYRPRKGIIDSEWVGLWQFERFFNNRNWPNYLRNTLTISLYQIAAGFPIPIMLAMFLHVSEKKVLKKVVQNVSYLPHFISVVILVGILNQVLSPVAGLYAAVCKLFQIPITEDIRSNPDAFYHLYVWSGVWQQMGWSAIIYVAALSGVSQELHEAAKIDGASRWKRVLHVDIPAILPTICMMLILRFGSIISVGHEKVYLMQTSANLSRSEIISTYVYKKGIGESNYSFGTAVGLMNTTINTGMILLVNWITDRLSDGENSLF